MGRWRLSWIALALAAACEPEPADYPLQKDIFDAAVPNELILLSSSGELVSADVENDQVIGPEINLFLERTGAGLAIRGIVFNRVVSLTVTGNRATGVVDAAPLQLVISREEAGVRAQGLVEGTLANYQLDDLHLSGTVGRCGYELTRSGRRYEGARSCGGPPESVHLLLPPQLSHWNDTTRMTLLGLVLKGRANADPRPTSSR